MAKRTISIYLILKLFTFIARKIEIGTTRLPSRRRSHIATGSSAIFYGRKKNIFHSWVWRKQRGYLIMSAGSNDFLDRIKF